MADNRLIVLLVARNRRKRGRTVAQGTGRPSAVPVAEADLQPGWQIVQAWLL